MRERLKFALIALSLSVIAGCDSGVHSAKGFRLPAGDAERGKKEFAALACNSCHEVSGVDLPKPNVQPPVPVMLGGEVYRIPSDGYLVTSIINPSFVQASYSKERTAGKSRMPDYGDKMTVRQLADVVAFVQSRYKELPRPELYPSH